MYTRYGSCGCHSSYAKLDGSQLTSDSSNDETTGHGEDKDGDLRRRRGGEKRKMSTVQEETPTMLQRMMNRRGCAHAAYEPTQIEHIANTASHGIGILPGFYATYLMQLSARDIREASVLYVYGLAIALLFICSTAYHTAEMLYRPGKRSMRFWLHVCDRAGIYLYIAAGYTPWLFLRDAGWLGVYMRYIVWISAFLGCMYQYVFHERYKTVETLLYVAIGGVPAVVLVQMSDWSGMWASLCGGICYVVGIAFFKADGVIPFAHAIWHLHVLAGAFFQFVAIYYYLLDDASRQLGENMG